MAGHRRKPSSVPIGQLWHDVLRARAMLSRARDRQALRSDSRGAVDAARLELVEALQAYAARLDALGTPVPYRLRDELRLNAALVAVGRQ